MCLQGHTNLLSFPLFTAQLQGTRFVLASCSELSKEAQSQTHERQLFIFASSVKHAQAGSVVTRSGSNTAGYFVMPVTQHHRSPEKTPKLLFLPSILPQTDLLAEPPEHSSPLSEAVSNHDPSGELKVGKLCFPPQQG